MTRLTRALVFVGATLLSASAWVADAQAMQIKPVTGASGVEAWLVEDHSVPVVTIRFAFAGGAARDPVGKGGAASMVASLLDEGAGPYDSLAFHRRIDDLAGQLRFSAAQDEFDGSLRSLKQNLFDSADLLRLALAEPRFAPEDIERIRGETLAGLARQAKNPRSLSGRLWMHDAFEKHPYGSSGFRGLLMNEIREKRARDYGVPTQLVPYRHAGLIVGNVATESGRVAESIALVREEWRHMREEGPTAVELENAKTYLTGSFPLGLDSTQHIAGVLVQMQQDKLGIDYLDRRASLIGGVTLDEARSVAKKLFDPGALSFAVVGDPADVEPTRSPRPPKF